MDPRPRAEQPDEAFQGLHPAFRILLLLVLASMLFRYSLAAMVLVLTVLLGMAVASGQGALEGILKALRRIRWLLLSIVVIYLWVAPEAGPAGRSWYVPSWSELDLALRRAGVLVVLVSAVELLRRHTNPARMAAGLVGLLRPLAWLGVDTGTFARRLALTLDAVPLLAGRVARASASRRIRRGVAGWGDAAAMLVREIESGAAVPLRDAALPSLPRPSPRDWVAFTAGASACLLAGAI
jgi:energy-coupling factor transporter transmembrane protein EcfT